MPDSALVVDCETTGLRAGTRLIELGAVWCSAGVLSGHWSAALDGSDDASLRESLRALRDRAWGRTVVMHNAGFDLRVLSSEAARVGVENPVRSVLCTRRIAQRVMTGLSSFDLQTVALALGIIEPVRHRALADAELTAKVYEALRSRG